MTTTKRRLPAGLGDYTVLLRQPDYLDMLANSPWINVTCNRSPAQAVFAARGRACVVYKLDPEKGTDFAVIAVIKGTAVFCDPDSTEDCS